LTFSAGIQRISRPKFAVFTNPAESILANSKQALKRARQNEKHRQHNAGLRSRMRTSVKAVRRALQGEESEKAASLLTAAAKKLDQAAAKNLIHANKAARYKSRLNTQVKRLATGEQAS